MPLQLINQSIFKLCNTGIFISSVFLFLAGQALPTFGVPLTIQVTQQTDLTLEAAWANRGFTAFSWIRMDDSHSLYNGTVYTEVTGNTLSIYNSYLRSPLGQLARCGGLGCDLGKGALIATLEVEPQGNSFIVKSASGSASFLQGAVCNVLQTDYPPVLECISNQSPAFSNIPSRFRFSPGT
jgi:hypothetical protein